MHIYAQNNLDNLLFKFKTVKTKVVFQEKSDALSRPFSNHLRKKRGIVLITTLASCSGSILTLLNCVQVLTGT